MTSTSTQTSTTVPVVEDGVGTGSDLAGSKLGWPDLLVILVYFVFVLAVGLISSWRNRQGGVAGYFMASRNMHWIPVGASLFASNIGSGHFIGLAGSGAAGGLGVAGFEQGSVYTLLVLGWLFVPVYMSSGVYTMPEYLRERFGGQRIRVYVSFLSLLLYIFTKISADLYAGALFIQLALNKSSVEWLYISILLLLVVAAVFTIAGGLTAVVWTDFVQTILMVGGAFVLMAMSLHKVGGYSSLMESFQYATADIQATNYKNESCGEPPSDYRHLIRTIEPGKSDYPWTGMLIGLRLNSVWYWCADQVIVQRTLASRDMTHAKAGCILAAYLKFLPLWLLVLPGMAARILFPNRVACASPEECVAICGSPGGCTNIAYVELVLNLLPTGMCGLMLAVMMAALMSSLTSIFNSASTVFTIDVWQLARRWAVERGWGWGRKGGPNGTYQPPSSRELLMVGRIFVVVLVCISVIWIPVIQTSGNSQLFDYIQAISSFLAPPICAVFILAVFWPRTNEPGAFWGLMIGLVIGMLRFVVQFYYRLPPCGSGLDDTRPWLVKKLVGNVHYLHFSTILWLVTGLITISVSLITPPIPQHCLYRLTFWSRKDRRVRQPIDPPLSTPSSPPCHTTTTIDTTCTNNVSNNANGTSCSQMQLEEANAGKGQEGEEETLTEEDKANKAVDFLMETPYWRSVLNWNAVLTIVLCTFVYAFFA